MKTKTNFPGNFTEYPVWKTTGVECKDVTFRRGAIIGVLDSRGVGESAEKLSGLTRRNPTG